jgi:4-amino-4-deoxy-L-arabinose transferase-like glycosyltransferase
MGSQISWLLPAALVLLAAGLVVRYRAPRTDRTRAALVLWGGWLLVTGLAFSLGKGIIHPYYTVALAPAIGAIIGIGGAAMWARRRDVAGRTVLASAVGLTAVWAWILMRRSPTWMPELRSVILLVGLVAAAGLLVWPWIDRWARRAVVVAALLASFAGPATYTFDTVATPHSGAIPSAGPAVTTSARFGPGGGGGRAGGAFGRPGQAAGGFTGRTPGGFTGTAPGGFGGTAPGGLGGAPTGGRTGGALGGLLNSSTPSATLVKYLENGAAGYRWVLATVGSNEAAGYQLSTGKAVMSIGGFNGTDPAPTLAQFEKLVTTGKVHYFIGGGGAAGPGASNTGTSTSAASQITSWVESHYSSTTVGGVTVYNLAVARS